MAGPSYLRPWPRAGLMKTPSNDYFCWRNNGAENDLLELVLYQVEGCAESRLVREVLCTLELPYLSIPSGKGCSIPPPPPPSEPQQWRGGKIPLLMDGDEMHQGAQACRDYLWRRYYLDDDLPQAKSSRRCPTWFDPPPLPNFRRVGSVSVRAYTAFGRGSRTFCPPRAME